MVPRFYACCSFTVFAFCIQELCCLDLMILVLFTTFGIPHFEIMLTRFHVPFSFYGMCILNYGIMLPWFHDSKFYLRHLHSAFRNYVASILCCFFHLRYLNSAFPILEIMLPRFYDHWLFTNRIWNSTYLLYVNYICCLDSIELERGGLKITCETG